MNGKNIRHTHTIQRTQRRKNTTIERVCILYSNHRLVYFIFRYTFHSISYFLALFFILYFCSSFLNKCTCAATSSYNFPPRCLANHLRTMRFHVFISCWGISRSSSSTKKNGKTFWIESEKTIKGKAFRLCYNRACNVARVEKMAKRLKISRKPMHREERRKSESTILTMYL